MEAIAKTSYRQRQLIVDGGHVTPSHWEPIEGSEGYESVDDCARDTLSVWCDSDPDLLANPRLDTSLGGWGETYAVDNLETDATEYYQFEAELS